MKILTTHPKGYNPLWCEQTVLLDGWLDGAAVQTTGLRKYVSAASWGAKLFNVSKRYDAIITGSELAALAFSLLQATFRRKSRRIPHIFIHSGWELPSGSTTGRV